MSAPLLTFDDGPSDSTGEILDLLSTHGVKAVFYVIGLRATQRPDLVERADADGHVIGNHTWDHAAISLEPAHRAEREAPALLSAWRYRRHMGAPLKYAVVERERLAEAGRLSVDRATRLMLAAGIGVVLTLTPQPESERDASLWPLARELVLSAVLVDAPETQRAESGLGSAQARLGQALSREADDTLAALTEPERGLMARWVERM